MKDASVREDTGNLGTNSEVIAIVEAKSHEVVEVERRKGECDRCCIGTISKILQFIEYRGEEERKGNIDRDFKVLSLDDWKNCGATNRKREVFLMVGWSNDKNGVMTKIGI